MSAARLGTPWLVSFAGIAEVLGCEQLPIALRTPFSLLKVPSHVFVPLSCVTRSHAQLPSRSDLPLLVSPGWYRWEPRLPVCAPGDRSRVLAEWSRDASPSGRLIRERTLPFKAIRSLRCGGSPPRACAPQAAVLLSKAETLTDSRHSKLLNSTSAPSSPPYPA